MDSLVVSAARLLAAARSMDVTHLLSATRKSMRRLGYTRFVEECAFPVLDTLGHDWEANGEGVAAEHTFAAIVESLIRERALELDPPSKAPAW